MLNSFENTPAARRPPGASFFIQDQAGVAQEAGAEAPSEAVPPQRALTRLYARIWLIVFFAGIILVLASLYSIPSAAALLAVASFAAGAAFIPRSGLPVAASAMPQSRSKPVEPLEIATALIGGLPDPALILSRDGTLLSFNLKAE